MSITITFTKIVVPRRRGDLLTRNRLNRYLDDLIDCKILLVAAPAGYGKTSLLVDWVHQSDLPVCWFSLDRLDQDFYRFVTHFLAAISQVFPSFGKQSRTALEDLPNTKLDINRLIPVIVNDAYENIPEHFAIVLDDYHTVDASREINEFINQLAVEIDENCHLIIASRTLLSLPDLPLLVGRSLVKGLSYDELAFRVDEIQSLMLQNYQQSISHDFATEIEKETEGWITGLLLSAQTMWAGLTDRSRIARVSGVDVYDYLAQQVLDYQDPILRKFLLETSLLEEFDYILCQSVFGDPPENLSWQGLIGDVLQNNLFVIPVENKGTWLRYHHLFRDFLQTQIIYSQPERSNEILERLAKIYIDTAEWEKAYEILLRIGSRAGILQLIELAGTHLLKRGRFNLLAKWLSTCTPNELSEFPSLISLQGSVDIQLGDVSKGILLLTQAENSFRELNKVHDLALLLIRRASGHRFIGNYEQSLTDAIEALRLVQDQSEMRNLQADALHCIGLCYYRMGDLHKSLDYLKESQEAFMVSNDPHNEASVHMDIGLVLMSLGEKDTALLHYEFALDHWRENKNVINQANVLNNLGVLHHGNGNYETAVEVLDDALRQSRKSGNTRIEAFSLASLGDVYFELDLFETAQLIYWDAREICRKIDNRFLLFYLNLAEANLALKNNDRDLLTKRFNDVAAYTSDTNSFYEKGLAHLLSGQILHFENMFSEADRSFQSAIQCFIEGGQKTEEIRAHLGLAQTNFAQDNLSKCLSELRLAHQRYSEIENSHQIISFYREIKTVLADPIIRSQWPQARIMLEKISAFEEQLPVIHRILRTRKTIISINQPPKIDIKTLGRSQVYLLGELVDCPEWTHQKTVREFFFLLVSTAASLSKEQIGLYLWPDSSPKKLKTQFKNTLYRLRRALGRNVVLYDDKADTYTFNPYLDYECDFRTFLDYVGQAEAMLNPERINLLKSAFDLYEGDYLPDIEGSWVAADRIKLRQTFMKVGTKLAQCYIDQKKFQEALNTTKDVLRVDPCHEEAHRIAMHVHAQLGNRADLVRQFDECRNALDEELGISPSPQTHILFEKLTA